MTPCLRNTAPDMVSRPPTIMSLLVLPAELLERIVMSMDPRAGSSRAIRLTCRTLCDVATPFVFERFYINLTKMERDKSHTIRFLNELSRGRRLGRFIRSLYFCTSSASYKSNFGRLQDALSFFKNTETFFARVGKLILAAVTEMQALQEFHWKTLGRVAMHSNIIGQIIHSLSNHPHLHFVSISACGIKRDIPCAPFHSLTHLTIKENGSLDYAPAIIANSPNLLRLKVIIDRLDCPSPPHFPVLSLFGAFPEGTHSSVRQLILSGSYFSLEPSTVPALIPHLWNLSRFLVPLGFDIPDEFWNALLDAKVFLHYVSSCHLRLRDSFLNYLGSHRRLKVVRLQLGRINAQDVRDEHRARFFFRHVIPINSWSLTSVLIQPEYAGCWCFDVSMLGALSLCANLTCIGICVDRQRARVKHGDNVIVTLPLNCIHFINLTVIYRQSYCRICNTGIFWKRWT
ncbi:hypothetical protein DFS33DRAFT_1359108 [Desarmillaria ectypa]|nr:hypothetical protein DFS33DRAFT_1359108 [Desarmillaria ectypa]